MIKAIFFLVITAILLCMVSPFRVKNRRFLFHGCVIGDFSDKEVKDENQKIRPNRIWRYEIDSKNSIGYQ